MEEVEKLISLLSPIEREILPYLKLKSEQKISSESKSDAATVKRALLYLGNKGIIKMQFTPKKMIVLGANGILYQKNGLPERRLLNVLADGKSLSLKDAKDKAKLSDNELSVTLGALKKKALIGMKAGMISLNASKQEVAKKSLEEKFIEALPMEAESLVPEQKLAFENLKSRKDIISVEETKESSYEITSLGNKVLLNLDKVKSISANTIEALTPEMLRNGSWKGKKFRHYDVTTKVPQINGGKRHFVNQAIEYARDVWLEMGFEEMEGNVVNSSFWDFDALFVPQDHPAREMQDTFFLAEKAGLPDKKIVNAVKNAHEKGTAGSKGWQYAWSEEQAKKMVLRTHTTVLSAQTLSQLKKSEWPKKFFALGRVYRNETLDWKHLFEFNQTEGIVVDPNANFRDLIGYLKEFFGKMGFEKARFRPSFFPYTEPSIEIDVFHPVHKKWIELGGAGILRPEVVEPLLGEAVPVLAWGPGFDRLILDYYKITDIRELYDNDLSKLRQRKSWIKD